VVRKPETVLASALNRVVDAGLLFRQGVPPHASYLFKHALVQDAAYGTLLREPRRSLHSRIVESLETHFPEIAESQPELLAHHCAEAGLTEKAVGLWGKAGQRSLSGSALVEATAQLHRALVLIATLSGTTALRAEQIRLQVALANALMHIKGYSAPETKASFEQARLYIEQAEALGEPLEDPLLLFSILYGSWVENLAAFNGDVCRELAGQFLALAEKQEATIPLMVGHRIMGRSLMDTGDIAEGRAHYDQAIALYEPSKHRSVATRFGQDAQVSILSSRSLTLWLLGYPKAALTDSDLAVKHGRETGQAAALMYALGHVPWTYIHCGHYAAVSTQADELVALAEKNGTLLWRACGTMMKGCIFASTGEASKAIELIRDG
jgi:tetratricopeptide (TPR) repeat protein